MAQAVPGRFDFGGFMKHWIWAALAAGLLAGCGAQEAGKGQFRDVLARYAETNEVCLPLALDADGANAPLLGSERIALPRRDAEDKRINEAAVKQMRALESAGLYERLKENDDDAALVFVLTEKGRRHTRASLNGPLFCLGREHVDKVQYYTEPATNAAGLTVSRVVYEGSITMDGWGKRLIRHGSEAWQNRLPLKRVEQATLVKTNDGWRDMRELPPVEGVAQTAQ